MRIHGLAGITRGEFRGHSLAEDDRARRAQRHDASGVPRRTVMPVDRRPVLGRHVRSRNDVFDPDRHAVQRSLHRGAIKRPRLGHDLVRIEMHPGTDRRLALGDPIEMFAGHPLGRQRARGHAGRKLNSSQTSK